MKEIINIFILFFASGLFFTVAVGYGFLCIKKILKVNTNNLFYIFFFGIIIIFLIQYLLYFFFKINYFTNYTIIILGIYFFFNNFKPYQKQLKIFFVALIFLIIILIIGKTHEDFKHHHLQLVNEIFNSKITLGLSNLNPQFIYIPSLVYVIAVTKLNFFENNFFHIIPYLIFVNFLCYLYFEYLSKQKKNLATAILITLLLYLIQFKFLKKHGFDVASFVFAFVAFLEILKHKKQILLPIIILIFAISIKITAVFSLPIFFYYFIKSFKEMNSFFLFFKSRFFLFLTFLLLVIVLSNFFNNGCIAYFIKNTCLDKSTIKWSIDGNQVNKISNQTELDAKGFYTQSRFKKEKYLENFNWVPYWFSNNFKYKILDYLIVTSIVLILFKIFFKTKIKYNIKITEILVSFSCVVIWFFTIPTLRYGYVPIGIFLFYIYSGLKIMIIYKVKNKINLIVVIFILIVNFANFVRINSEFKRKDAGYFNNFPWYHLPERKYEKKFSNINNYYYIKNDNLIYPCWNIPSPCLDNENIKFENIFFFKIVIRL
jgi:hypothetical protein